MFTEITIVMKKVTKILSIPYKKIEQPKHQIAPSNNTFGGFTEQDWINVGNDLRHGILEYGSSKLK
ncbi:hypothetical protein H3T48_05125 [Lactobacillus sp. M0403]|uniref:hypothetical protein n=1 Tax=Lactobacillus sp. M0403 TaxID=2751031 RepID=UPI0018DDEA51|nr:hypothetical protein [Lactobacillus sp. M0403]MBI0093097.1 hypothetical protein [Lactobacillus sp. M0403]